MRNAELVGEGFRFLRSGDLARVLLVEAGADEDHSHHVALIRILGKNNEKSEIKTVLLTLSVGFCIVNERSKNKGV